MSRLSDLRSRVAARDAARDEARKAGLINQPRRVPLTIEQMEEKIQMLESAMTQRASAAPALVIPQRDGSLHTASEHAFEQRAAQIVPGLRQELHDFYELLRHEPQDSVTNYDEYDFESGLNGVGYRVPAKSSRKLPRTLAQHYERKREADDRYQSFIKNAGGVDGDKPHSFMPFPEFSKQITSYDQEIGGGSGDSDSRRYFF